MNSQTHSHINSQKRISDFELVTESEFFLVKLYYIRWSQESEFGPGTYLKFAGFGTWTGTEILKIRDPGLGPRL